MVEAASMFRYSYAVLGVGFIVIAVGLLLAEPGETTSHPSLMRFTALTSPTCTDGVLEVPTLTIEGVPQSAQSLVITAGDAVYYGIPPAIPEYGPVDVVTPCTDTTLTLYATDITLAFIQAPTKAEVLAAIEGHVVETTELTVVTEGSETEGR